MLGSRLDGPIVKNRLGIQCVISYRFLSKVKYVMLCGFQNKNYIYFLFITFFTIVKKTTQLPTLLTGMVVTDYKVKIHQIKFLNVKHLQIILYFYSD